MTQAIFPTTRLSHCGLFLYFCSQFKFSPVRIKMYFLQFICSCLSSLEIQTLSHATFVFCVQTFNVLNVLKPRVADCGMYILLCDHFGVTQQIQRGWSLFHIRGANP